MKQSDFRDYAKLSKGVIRLGSIIRCFARLTRVFPGRAILLIITVMTVILAACELFVSYSLKLLMDSVLGQNYGMFSWVVAVMAGVIIIDSTFRYLRNRWAGTYGENGVKILREMLSRQTVRMPAKELDQHHSGDMLSRLTNDMNLVRGFASQTLVDLIYNPIAAIGALIILFSIHVKLTIATLVLIPIIFALSAVASRPVAKYTAKMQAELAVVNSYNQDTVNGIEVVRAFGLGEILSKKYAVAIKNTIIYGFKIAFGRSIILGINSISGVAPFLLCFGLGGYWVVKGEMTPGDLIAYINLLNPLATPIAQLPNLIGALSSQMQGAKRIFEILDLNKEREDGEIFTPLNEGTVISFDNVSFAYGDDVKPVLGNLSFALNAGEKVAIVGPSGSGKTTIIKMLLGYYDNYTGEINIYRNEIKKWNLKALRDQISLVSQDTYLFPGTIAENISYGKPGVEMEKIIFASTEANAHEFIIKLAQSYESNVGEFGDKLSGGQKQRIAIARAIIKDAPILLLDEATSSLDSQSEYLVQTALDDYMKKGKTALIIAHRLSTIQKADRILVIDQGRVVETGKHEDLLAKEGIYKNLYLRQLALEDNEGLAKEAVV